MDNPLVLVHGAGDSTRAWRAQTAFFGSRAHAIDLPGHGERPDTLPEQVQVLDYVQVVREIIKTELHLTLPVIVGHSMGGLIALQMGLDYGTELGGLILVGTGARMRVAPALLANAKAQPEQALQVLRTPAILINNELDLSTQVANEQTGPQNNTLYRDLLACNGFDVMQRLDELHLPTLIICGAQERNAPVKFSEYLHTHINGSTLRIIPNAAHYVQREKSEEVNQAIEEWLREN